MTTDRLDLSALRHAITSLENGIGVVPERLHGVLPAHRAIVHNILQQWVPQHEVWAFGSRAKGAAKPHSDLDLAVISDQPLGWVVLARLSDAFAESDLPWRVDVVDWATTSEAFRQIIERDKVRVQTRVQAERLSDNGI